MRKHQFPTPVGMHYPQVRLCSRRAHRPFSRRLLSGGLSRMCVINGSNGRSDTLSSMSVSGFVFLSVRRQTLLKGSAFITVSRWVSDRSLALLNRSTCSKYPSPSPKKSRRWLPEPSGDRVQFDRAAPDGLLHPLRSTTEHPRPRRKSLGDVTSHVASPLPERCEG